MQHAVDQTLILPDARRFGFRIYGRPLGEAQRRSGTSSQSAAVLAVHGTPGSRRKYAPVDAAAARRGLTLISLDRWGYGLTDPHPDPSFSHWADDLAHIADALGLDRFAICGISGGGPFAAAAAAELRERVTAVALVAPVGPLAGWSGTTDAPRLDPMHTFSFRILPRSPLAVRFVFATYRGILRVSPHVGVALAMARNGWADLRLLMERDVILELGDMMGDSLSRGAMAAAVDLALFREPWDISPEMIQAPTRIWFGDQDRNVPSTALETLVDAVPNAELVRVDQQGHFWLSHRFDGVLDWLQHSVDH
ncbi:MAG: alpha/beta hydrolase [Pseudomonadota bacterium]